jgi:glycine/D-amino acid oxidase-like deaminating enzyme
MVMDYTPGVEREGLYFRDDTARRLVAGLHWEIHGDGERPDDPDTFKADPDWDYVSRCAELLGERFRDAARLRRAGGWCGLYPLTPDSLPILGGAPGLTGFHNAVGGGGVGLQLSPALGAIAADLLVRGETDVLPDLRPYRIERFSAEASRR